MPAGYSLTGLFSYSLPVQTQAQLYLNRQNYPIIGITSNEKFSLLCNCGWTGCHQAGIRLRNVTLFQPHKRTGIGQFKFCGSGTQIYLQHEEAGNIGIYCLSALPARLRGSENLRRVQHFRNHNRVRHRGENPRSRCQSGGYRNLDHIRRQWTFRPHRYPPRDLQARVLLPRVRGQETGLHGEGRHRVAYHQDESELIGPQWSNRYGRKGQGWSEHVHEIRKQRPGASPDEQCHRYLRPPSGRQDGQSGPHLRQPHFSPQRRTRLRQCLIRDRP